MLYVQIDKGNLCVFWARSSAEVVTSNVAAEVVTSNVADALWFKAAALLLGATYLYTFEILQSVNDTDRLVTDLAEVVSSHSNAQPAREAMVGALTLSLTVGKFMRQWNCSCAVIRS